jgi:hypothetical protein
LQAYPRPPGRQHPPAGAPAGASAGARFGKLLRISRRNSLDLGRHGRLDGADTAASAPATLLITRASYT